MEQPDNRLKPTAPKLTGGVILFALGLLTFSVVATVALTSWTLDLIAPTHVVGATVTWDQYLPGGRGGTHLIEVTSDDGRGLDLHGTPAPPDFGQGEPILVGISDWTGNVVWVRTAEGLADATTDWLRVLMMLLVAALLGYLARGTRWRRIWNLFDAKPVAATIMLVSALVVGYVEFRGADRTAPEHPLDLTFGLAGKTPESLPKHPAPAGQDAVVGPLSVRLLDAPGNQPALGAADWVKDAHLVVLHLSITRDFRANADNRYLAIRLLGPGPGSAKLLLRQDCGTLPTDSTGLSVADGKSEGFVCFMVPNGFDAQHLLLSYSPLALELVAPDQESALLELAWPAGGPAAVPTAGSTAAPSN
jgi:hypothetical protein